MENTRSRLRRHLSFANVVACVALFAALGGVSYAAATINGNEIKKRTIGAGKLKNGTLTSKQVKADALTGSVIDESTLTIVPTAQTANSATTATSATTAQSAATAQSATTAQTAATADSATTATTAINADHATEADTAADAETLEGFSAEDLELTCPTTTDLYGGMCWDKTVRPIKTWIGASIECGDSGGRLPSLSELIAYLAQPGEQVSESNWSADVIDLPGPGEKEVVLIRDETTTDSKPSAPGTFGFRCVFYPSN